MKFSEMPYERPDVEGLKKEITEFTESLKNADTYEEARDIFVRKDQLDRHVKTLSTLTYIRHSIDTRDEFYDKDYLKFLYEISVDTTVYRDTDILEENIRKSTEFFKKFLKPEGIPYGCGILLIRNQRVLGILNLFRNNENGDFTDKEMFILDVLKNHLENMVHNTVYHSRQGMAAKQYLEQAAENYDLTPRELEILELIGEGLSNQEICDKLVISTSTVKKHIYNLFQKTNVSSRTQLLNRIYKF